MRGSTDPLWAAGHGSIGQELPVTEVHPLGAEVHLTRLLSS